MSNVDSWQARLDEDFPNGLRVYWDGEEDSQPYPVGHAHVFGVNGLVPLVHLPVSGVDKAFDLSVVTYEKVQDDPLAVRVRWQDDEGRAMIWVAAPLSEEGES